MSEVEKDDTGVGAIVKAFIKNPVGAVQIVGVIVGLMGVYYAIEGEVKEVKATQLTNYDKLSGKLDAVLAATNDNKARIDAGYSRSDTRYSAVIAKLSAHDVDIAKLVSNMDFLVEQARDGDSGKRGMSRPPLTVTPTPMLP